MSSPIEPPGTASAWTDTNQAYLQAMLEQTHHILGSQSDSINHPERLSGEMREIGDAVEMSRQALPSPAALDILTQRFELSEFERQILLLCVGVELDRRFGPLCAALQPEASGSPWPTFHLALARLPDAHWSAFAPASPLRYWRLIDVDPAKSLVTSPLRIDERILHYLVGVNQHDQRLTGYFEQVPPASVGLLHSQQALAERVATHLDKPAERLPAIELVDGSGDQSARIASACCERLECALFRVAPGDLPQDPRERDALILLWRRETLLSRCAMLVVEDGAAPDPGSTRLAARQLTDNSYGPVFFTDRDWRPRERTFLSFHIEPAAIDEEKALWRQHLGEAATGLDDMLDRIAAHFRLDPATISSASVHVLRETSSAELAPALWDRCRKETRPQMHGLAEPVVSEVSWSDLMLPAAQLRLLKEVAQHAAHRHRVLESWPFAARGAHGQGIAALFTGASGTGKSLAADVLARELRMDLYRVDLSRVVSKYIGETEKNLARIFDTAEDSGVILLFDEADALFGKRSEVRDSHDRYANIEVSYLLQRMEHYRGLAILTSNMNEAMDRAFLRRFRFVVAFPFPAEEERLRIWQRLFPPEDQECQDELDYQQLAALDVAGGNIHNIAVFAAFEAAGANENVGMKHLLRAAQVEYGKMDKTLDLSVETAWR